jgi:anti-sigma factor RsiW
MDAEALEGGGFSMKHVDRGGWVDYVADTLSDERRAALEEHLYQCDDCMASYMEALGQEVVPSAGPKDASLFDEKVMSAIALERIEPDTNKLHEVVQLQKASPRRTLFHHPLFHYAVAASITLLLMSTGFFQFITDQTEEWRSSVHTGARPSVSEHLTDRTTEALASLQTKIKEGPAHAK